MDEIQKSDERERLYNLYQQRHREFKKASSKRLWLTFLFFLLGYWILLCICTYTLGSLENEEFISQIKAFAALLIPALFFSGMHFFINFSIFEYLFRKDREENERLLAIKKQFDEIK